MQPIVSIVTGTYNRLNWLAQMINSVRHSIGFGIPYEIIVVDGGSIDGTLDWLKVQKDVVLIEHGKLLGAVKAFNDGAYAAKGRYVILANDDIEFIGKSITCAIRFMEDSPNIGIGCFYQDRRGWNWHVEQMPAVQNGIQTSVYYGQVCIVPKWLGDTVGWWGNYLRTYGGDNELSCNVLELGYKVLPVPCACIHDFTPQDDLRKINVTPTDTGHPDTKKWVDKWTRGKYVGPMVADMPKIPNPINDRYFRILYAPIYETGHAVQRVTKKGLRLSLAKIGLVYEYDYVASRNPVDELYDLLNMWKPDLLITQIHSIGKFRATDINDYRHDFPNTFLFNWNGDYHPEHLYSQDYINLLKQFHLTGLVTTEPKRYDSYKDVNWFYWQIGYEETRDIETFRIYDVVWQANGYSQSRLSLAEELSKKLGKLFALYGSWPTSLQSKGNTLYNFDEGARVYRSGLMTISDSQWQHATGFVSNRLFQALDAGVLLLQQKIDGMEELLGLRDGEHLVVWNTKEELFELIDFYRNHPELAIKIARVGQAEVRKNHSFDCRVKQLMGKIIT